MEMINWGYLIVGCGIVILCGICFVSLSHEKVMCQVIDNGNRISVGEVVDGYCEVYPIEKVRYVNYTVIL